MNTARQIVEEDCQTIVADLPSGRWKLLEGQTILLTGPQGVLGSGILNTIEYLNRTLFHIPCQVIAIHRSPIIPNGILSHTLDNPQIQYLRSDASKNLRGAIEILRMRRRLRPVSHIIHAAGYSTPLIFTSQPIETFSINMGALQWLLPYAVEQDVGRFVWFSSAEIYGTTDRLMTEQDWGNTDPLGQRACYVESKRCGEAFCLAYHKQQGVPVILFRPQLIYGPGLAITDRRAMAEFIKTALLKEPITLQDQGEAIRSYCYISDAMRLFWRAFFSPGALGEVFNIANTENISIYDLATLIHKLCDITIPVKRATTILNNLSLLSAPWKVGASFEKAQKWFGWEPQVCLSEGLTRTITWNKGLYD